jgi:hypothetical protein
MFIDNLVRQVSQSSVGADGSGALGATLGLTSAGDESLASQSKGRGLEEAQRSKSERPGENARNVSKAL